jgi:hypothetical protein
MIHNNASWHDASADSPMTRMTRFSDMKIRSRIPADLGVRQIGAKAASGSGYNASSQDHDAMTRFLSYQPHAHRRICAYEPTTASNASCVIGGAR